MRAAPHVLQAIVLLTACNPSLDLSFEPETGAPLASAGTGSAYLVGTTVTLDGSASVAPHGDALEYRWTIASRPAGSAATIESPTEPLTQLQLDAVGDFVVILRVTDPYEQRDISEITLSAEAPVISIDTSADQITEWRVPVELSGSFAIEGNKPATLLWELIEAPDDSTATLTSTNETTTSFVPDEAGRYLARFTVETAHNSLSEEVEILATAPQQVLSYTPIAMEYASSLDLIVTISDGPSQIHLLDPTDGSDVSIALPLPPMNLSLGLDGNRVTVGHEDAVTIVSLSPFVVEQTVNVDSPAPVEASCLLGLGNLIHCLSALSLPIQTIDLSDGSVIEGDRAVGQGERRLHPTEPKLYVAADQSQALLVAYDTTSPPVTTISSSTINTRDGRFWFTPDGTSIVTGTGDVYHSSTDPAIEMTFRGELDQSFNLRSVAVSPTSGRIATTSTTLINTHDGQTLDLITSENIPDALHQGVFRRLAGKLISFRSDGSELYVVANSSTVYVLLTLEP